MKIVCIQIGEHTVQGKLVRMISATRAQVEVDGKIYQGKLVS